MLASIGNIALGFFIGSMVIGYVYMIANVIKAERERSAWRKA